MPKRPQTSFFIYMKDTKPKLQEKHPELSLIEISKKLGEKWKKLSNEKKNVLLYILVLLTQSFIRNLKI